MERLFIITGNRRGLGAALSQELKDRGQRVVGCSSASEPPFRVDVSHEQQVQAWAAHVLTTEGVPDVVINNAATVTPLKPLL